MIGAVNVSLASFPGRKFDDALVRLETGNSIPVLDDRFTSTRGNTIQLCPQNFGVLDEAYIEYLQALVPNKELRLHANVRVLSQRLILDVADFDPEHPYWKRLRDVHLSSCAKIYSAHAGRRSSATMLEVIDKTKAMADFMRCPVAIEGHYPSRGDPFLMSSWQEWEQVFNADIPFVVDVSHAAIVAHMKRQRNDDLVGAMLSSPNCLEIHLSGNDGRSDQHRAMTGNEWWWPLLDSANPNATFFYEGIVKKMTEN